MRGTKTEIRPGVWRLRVYVGRRLLSDSPVQASKTFRGGSRAAEDELRRFVGQVLKARSPERSATFAQLLEEWMTHRAARVSPTTLEADRAYIDNRITPALGRIRLDRLTARDIDRAYAAWLDDGLAPGTVRKIHSIISAALHQAVKWDRIDRAVSEKASPPSPAGQLTRSIKPAELVTLIQKARDDDPPLAMAISLGAVTGARRGELCAIRRSDLDTATATLTLARSVSVLKGGHLVIGPTKTHQLRRLILDDGTLKLIAWWYDWQADFADRVGVDLDPDPYLITLEPRAGRPMLPHTLTNQFSRLTDQLKMPYHFHELRHFAATQMISGGIDPSMASKRLGHARTHITLDIYAHAVAAADRHAAELLGAALPALPMTGD